MSIVVRNDPMSVPNRLLSIVEHMPAVQQCSLAAFAECIGESGHAYAQAMGKIIGDPNFLIKHTIVPSPSNVLTFNHLVEQYPDERTPIEFQVMHKRELDERLSKCDLVHFVAVENAPYFIGDFNRKRPTGVLELAATVKMQDIVWLDEEHVMAGPVYFWHDQYLDEIGTNHDARSKTKATLHRILYEQPLSHFCKYKVEDLHVFYDEQLQEQMRRTPLGSVVNYRRGGSLVDMLALELASRPTHEVYIVGPGRHIARRGMGAVFDLPVWLRSAIHAPIIPSNSPFLDRIYGCITGFKKSTDERNPVNIIIAVHLDMDNLPAYVLSRMNYGHLLQTNREVTISESFLTGVFSIWPASLYQGMCAPGHDADRHVNDRVVIGHIDIRMINKGPDSSDIESDSASITSEFGYRENGNGALRMYPHVREMIDFLVAIHDGRAITEISVVSPIRASCALDCLRDQDMLFNQVALSARPFATVGPPLRLLLQGRSTAYVKPLYQSFVEFCRGKAMKDLKSTNNQRTFHPQIPGRGAMALLQSLRPGNIVNISLGNMILTVEIGEPSFLDSMLGGSISEIDFREEGFCIVRIHGPLIFKWEMCISEEGHGPVEGILSVTVGGWSATDRFGQDVVKQCMDPRSSKKRRASSLSERKQFSGNHFGISKVQVAGENSKKENCDVTSHPDQKVHRDSSESTKGSASTKRKSVLYTAQDRMERYQRRMQHVPQK